MVYGKSLHRAKEVKIQLLDCKGSGLFIAKSQAANQGSSELGEEHSWDSELCLLLFFLACERTSACDLQIRVPPSHASVSSRNSWKQLSIIVSGRSLVQRSLNTVYSLCCLQTHTRICLSHFCHDAENNIGDVCLKVSFCKFKVLQISMVVFKNAFMA